MRFWPVQTGVAHAIDRAAIRGDAEQIWAEAVHLYQTGFEWFPSLAEMESLFVPQQEERREVDPWEAPICRYLRKEVPEEIDRKTGRGVERVPGYVTTETLMRDVLDLNTDRHDALAQKRVAQIMHLLGWESARVRHNDSRFRAWIRTASADGPSPESEDPNESGAVPVVVDYDSEIRLPGGERVRLLS
jgi:predicted P-loop ATPase